MKGFRSFHSPFPGFAWRTEKVGKQDYSCAAFKFQLAAFLRMPQGHQGILVE
jgi:hypothetical protein